MAILETRRLRLRTWSEDDLAELARIHADREVMRYIGPEGRPLTRDESREWLARARAHWDEHAFGLFATELAGSGRLIGWSGPVTLHWLRELMPAVEIGWLLDRPHWGRGLATEAGAAGLDFAFGELGLERIVAVHRVENVASERVMQKLGMRRLQDTEHPRTAIPLRIYEARAPG